MVTVTENGMLESSNNEEIKCFVKGGSTVLWVIETGTFVKPGDELVRLDDSVIVENNWGRNTFPRSRPEPGLTRIDIVRHDGGTYGCEKIWASEEQGAGEE